MSKSCWCVEFPPIIIPEEGKSCLCPACLKKKIQKKIDDLIENKEYNFIQSLGLPKAPQEDIDYYLNEDGLLVMTKWYHLRRGSCCENDCKHCAYKE